MGIRWRKRRNSLRGKSFLAIGEMDKAEEDFSRSIEMVSGDSSIESAEATLLLIEIYNFKEEFAEAWKVLRSVSNIVNNTDNDEMRSEYMIQLSRYLLGTYRIEAAKQFLDSLANQAVYAPEIHTLLSKIYLMRGDYKESLARARESIVRLKRSGTPIKLVEGYETLGDVFRLLDDSENALASYRLGILAAADYEKLYLSNLIQYKIALCYQTDDILSDSLFNSAMDTTKREFAVNLSRYQIGYNAAKNNDSEKAGLYLNRLITSDDMNTIKYLKWRAEYILASLLDDDEKLKLLDSIRIKLGNQFPEPDYIKSIFGLRESRADLINSLADLRIKYDEMASAIDLLENGFSEKIAGRHFAMGLFDSTESVLIDSLISGERLFDSSDSAGSDYKGMNINKPRNILWGNVSTSSKELRNNISGFEAIIRFYENRSGYLAAYIDKSTIFVRAMDINEDSLDITLAVLTDLLLDQKRADSVLEKWYEKIISPFESFLEKRESLLIIPDGKLNFLPFEALKMPDSDIISEIYDLKRHIFLPEKFPGEPELHNQLAARFEEGNNPEIVLARYISEPFLLPKIQGENLIIYKSGRMRVSTNPCGGCENIIWIVDPIIKQDYLNLELQAILGARDGAAGFICQLWELSDEVKASYYWKFFSGVNNGLNYRDSFKSSRSFIFGHFDGIPGKWAAYTYISLN